MDRRNIDLLTFDLGLETVTKWEKVRHLPCPVKLVF